jgi:hypothetical protein
MRQARNVRMAASSARHDAGPLLLGSMWRQCGVDELLSADSLVAKGKRSGWFNAGEVVEFLWEAFLE